MDLGDSLDLYRKRRESTMTTNAPNGLNGETGDLSGKTTIVVGASRGLGRGIAEAFAGAGASVVAVARTAAALAELADGAAAIRPEVADAGDATVAGSLLDRYEPEALILVAGASPLMRPLQHQTWETFSVNWHTDVRIAFHWLRETLLKPLRPGSRVVVVSSGAALAGSPLSGGYAGAKATQRFITAYAQDEAMRAGLGITSPRCYPGSPRSPTSVGRRPRRTRPAAASPYRSTSTSSASRSLPRAPVPLWSSLYGQMPPPSHPVTS
jgi:NAD(P)-dependent dehydrogenase (short-subunit alcohol dehydrogenase family)